MNRLLRLKLFVAHKQIIFVTIVRMFLSFFILHIVILVFILPLFFLSKLRRPVFFYGRIFFSDVLTTVGVLVP